MCRASAMSSEGALPASSSRTWPRSHEAGREALRGALLYAAAVAVGEGWMTPDLAGSVISAGVVDELRSKVADFCGAALEWIG